MIKQYTPYELYDSSRLRYNVNMPRDFFPSAGEVYIDEFVNSLTSVNIGWSNFDSNIPIFFYYVGITNSKEAASRLDCQSVISVSSLFYYATNL